MVAYEAAGSDSSESGVDTGGDFFFSFLLKLLEPSFAPLALSPLAEGESNDDGNSTSEPAPRGTSPTPECTRRLRIEDS